MILVKLWGCLWISGFITLFLIASAKVIFEEEKITLKDIIFWFAWPLALFSVNGRKRLFNL